MGRPERDREAENAAAQEALEIWQAMPANDRRGWYITWAAGRPELRKALGESVETIDILDEMKRMELRTEARTDGKHARLCRTCGDDEATCSHSDPVLGL